MTVSENNITLSGIAGFLKENDNYLILCHRRPDGDTLGSGLALMLSLRHLGKTAWMACDNPPAANNLFLFDDPDELADRDRGDVIPIAVDVASRYLLGELERFYGDRIALKIDHHEMSEDFAVRNYTDASAAACGEILFELTGLLGVPHTAVARPLYAAISSDTGGFRYANTTARTHRIAAALLEAGADHTYIDRQLYENRTPGEIRALAAAYNGLRFFHDGRVAAVVITNQMRDRLSLSEDDLGVVSPITREICGVSAGITLRQSRTEPNRFTLSVRSGPEFPSHRLCGLFGGGGHPGAAGAELTASTPQRALQMVVSRIGCRDGRLFVQ